jgi:hypothetical protein
MEFSKIIFCTQAPKNTGLAYYYYLAAKDILSPGRVALIDEGSIKYEASLLSRAQRKLLFLSGKSSIAKMKTILEQCDQQNKNIVVLFNTANLRYEEIEQLSKQPNICLVHLLSDSPYGMHELQQKLTFQSLPLFDLVCIMSRALLPVLYQMGAKKVERLPFGYCRYTHFISEKADNPEMPESVFYFGTWTPVIESWLMPLKRFDLHIEGSFWKQAADSDLRYLGTRPNPNTDKNMALMARKAGVVVNFTRAPHGCFHTMKTFELTIAGGCVASNYSDEQAEFFTPGRGMSYFNTPGEMSEQVGSLLADKQKNKMIRENAIQQAMDHSYHSRVNDLLHMLKNIS